MLKRGRGGVIQPCCTHTGGGLLQLPPSPLLPQALRAHVRARMHTLPFFISSCFLFLSLCTHILCEAVKNRDEKRYERRYELQFSFIYTKTKCMFKKDNIFVARLELLPQLNIIRSILGYYCIYSLHSQKQYIS